MKKHVQIIALIVKSRVTRGLGMLSLLLLLPGSLFSTHIVGGEIGYRCLGNNQYEITVRVYRDCFNGDPDAGFDNPASVAVFDRAGVLIEDLRIPFMREDTVTNTQDDCLVQQTDVCVHTTIYVDTVELEFKTGGYQLVYQRCCRNVTINNIVNPLETGATYDIWLTEAAMNRCNSSPVFREWPPIYICANKPLDFDHSAQDLDGDSLVYRLCKPFQGATFAIPMPQPPNPPPYDELVYIEPTYSVENMLGFGEPLVISKDDGFMTAVPGAIGQYVVGVCVDEYDRETGELLSSTRRDFQYNVIECTPFEAAFEAPDVLCDELSVQLDNTTEDAQNFEWIITGNGSSFSITEPSPLITFPGTGTYQIDLLVEPNSICEATFSKTIEVTTTSIEVDFSNHYLVCPDQAYLYLTDLSTDDEGPPTAWEWIVSPDTGAQQSFSAQFPVVALPIGSSGTVQLNVTAANGCVASFSQAFNMADTSIIDLIPDQHDICTGDSIALNPLGANNPEMQFVWEENGVTFSTAVQPKIIATTGTRTIRVRITGPENDCVFEKEIQVRGGLGPELGFSSISDCQGLSYNFTNNSLNTEAVQWVIGDLANPIFTSMEESFSFEFPDEGTYEVYLIDNIACTDTLKETIEVQFSLLDIAFDYNYTDCAVGSLSVQFDDQSETQSDEILSRTWTLSDGRSSDLENPNFIFTSSQDIEVSLRIETAAGCIDSLTKEISINLIEDLPAKIPDTIGICGDLSVRLSPLNDPKYTYTWSPAEGIDDVNAPNPTFSQTGTYQVTIEIPGSANCSITDEVQVFIPSPINLSLIGGSTDPCDTSTELNIEADVEDLTVDWYVNGILSLSNADVFAASTPGENTYTAIARDNFGCTDTASISISLGGISIEPIDDIAICFGDTIEVDVVNNNPDDILSYTWDFEGIINTGQNSASISIIDAPIGKHELYLSILNQEGCSFEDTINIAVIDPNLKLDFEFEPQCNGTTVQFTNKSENAFDFLWAFGDPNNPNATSTEENPSYTYTEAGTYIAYLTIQHDVVCTDTIEQEIVVGGDAGFPVDFEVRLLECGNGYSMFEFENTTENFPGTNLTYTYTLENGVVFNSEDVRIQFNVGGPQNVKFTITSAEGCMGEITKEIDFPVVDFDLPDSIDLCVQPTAILNPNPDTSYTYEWEPGPGITDVNAPTQIVSPDVTTTYRVTVTDVGFEICTKIEEVTVIVPLINLELDLPEQIRSCDPILLETNENRAVSLTWMDSNGNVISDSSAVLVQPFQSETYILTAVSSEGCEFKDTVEVINDALNYEIEPGTLIEICEGDVQLNINNLDNQDTLNFLWTSDNLVITGTNTANPLIEIDRDGAFIVNGIISNQHNCIDTVEILIKAGDLKPLLPDTLNICLNDQVQLGPDASENLTYQWSPANLLTNPNVANPTTAPLSSDTQFFVTVTQEGTSCVVVDSVFVDVKDDIILDISNDTTLCANTSTTLELSATIEDGASIRWINEAGDTIGSMTTLSITVNDQSRTITAIATDTSGCQQSESVDIQVGTGLSIEMENDPDTACVDESLNLEISTMGGNPMVQWYKDSVLLNNEQGNSLSVIVEHGENNYFAIAMDELGCSDTAHFDFIGVTIEDLELDTLLTGCIGESFDLFPNANPGFEYSWSPADQLEDANVPNPRTLPLEEDVVFTVTINLPEAACTLEGRVEVDVNDDIITTQSQDTAVCPQTSLTLSATLQEGATIVWLDENDDTLSTSTTVEVEVLFDDRMIRAIATDTAGCTQEGTTNINIAQLEDTGIEDPLNGAKLEACAGIPTALNPNGNSNYEYQWSPETGLNLDNPHNPIATLDTSQLYMVTITNPENGCQLMTSVEVEVIENISITLITNDTMICEPVPLTLNAETNIPGNLNWFADAAMTIQIGSGNTIEVTPGEGSNLYYVKTEDLRCVDENDVDTIMVEVVNFGAVAPDTLQEVCKNTLLQLNANADERFTYQWSPAELLDNPNSPDPKFVASQDQVFEVIITSPDGMCMVTKEVEIKLKDPINLDAGEEQILCEGTTVKLVATSDNGQNLMWASDPEFTNLLLPLGGEVEIEVEGESQYYYVKGENGVGCTEIDSVFVGMEAISAELPDTVLICDDNEAAIITVVNNKANHVISYSWSPTNLISSDPTGGSTVTLNPGANGIINVSLENQYGCTDNLSTFVDLNDIAQAEIAPDNTDCLLPGNATFLEVINCQDCEYQWSITENGLNIIDRRVEVNPLETTTYSVTITKGECRKVESIEVCREGELCTSDNIFLPTAFSPNNDGENDVLFVRSNVIDELRFIVYNRWGQEVFETNDISVGWDGTWRGNPLPPDVYGTFVEATCIDGSTITLIGNVTLIR